MASTINQVLRQGVTAHEDGKHREAERLYRSILARRPTHPEANHNLGVLAVVMGKIEAALPYFKAAIENDPGQIQYWLNCIEAFIKLDQIDNAKQLLKQGRKHGLSGDQTDELERLLYENKHPIVTSMPKIDTCRHQIELLKELYGQRKLSETIEQATDLTRLYPKNVEIWNLSGAANAESGHHEVALESFNRAIELEPKYADSYNNLGIFLKNANDVENAFENYMKALVVKPGFATAYSNLSNALNNLGQHEDAAVNAN